MRRQINPRLDHFRHVRSVRLERAVRTVRTFVGTQEKYRYRSIVFGPMSRSEITLGRQALGAYGAPPSDIREISFVTLGVRVVAGSNPAARANRFQKNSPRGQLDEIPFNPQALTLVPR
jgi:hypothetical protein